MLQVQGGCKIRSKLMLCFSFRLLPQITWSQGQFPGAVFAFLVTWSKRWELRAGLHALLVTCMRFDLFGVSARKWWNFLKFLLPSANAGNHGLNLFPYLLFHYVACTTVHGNLAIGSSLPDFSARIKNVVLSISLELVYRGKQT